MIKIITVLTSSVLPNIKIERVMTVLTINLRLKQESLLMHNNKEIRGTLFTGTNLSKMDHRMKPMKHHFLQTIKFSKWFFSIKRKTNSMTVYQLQDLFPRSNNTNKLSNLLLKLTISNLVRN